MARLPPTSEVQWTPSHTRLHAMAAIRLAATPRATIPAVGRWM